MEYAQFSCLYVRLHSLLDMFKISSVVVRVRKIDGKGKYRTSLFCSAIYTRWKTSKALALLKMRPQSDHPSPAPYICHMWTCKQDTQIHELSCLKHWVTPNPATGNPFFSYREQWPEKTVGVGSTVIVNKNNKITKTRNKKYLTEEKIKTRLCNKRKTNLSVLKFTKISEINIIYWKKLLSFA